MNSFISSFEFSGFNLLLIICFVILFILTICNMIRVSKFKKEYKILMQSVGKGEDFNQIFSKCISEVEIVSRETEKLKNKTENLQKNIEKCIQKVGVIRYSAYNNNGGNLCFAIALLDFENNGVVINGIYSRDNTTMTYAKPIEHGKSKYTLVKEEEDAIELAKHNGYNYFLDLNMK